MEDYRKIDPPAPQAAGLSLGERLSAMAAASPSAIAILTPGRTAATFGQVIAQIDVAGCWLAGAGLSDGARVAIIGPDSAELALVMLGVMTSAIV